MAIRPYARVAHIIQEELPESLTHGWRTNVTATPHTLSGCPREIYSYRLLIAFQDERGWFVTTERNSLTTNRHINAVHDVIENLPGYTKNDDPFYRYGRQWTHYRKNA